MIVKITSKRQVTLPTRVLDELGVGAGDQLEIQKGAEGYILRPRQLEMRPRRLDVSKLGTLRDKIDPNAEPFDIRRYRDLGCCEHLG